MAEVYLSCNDTIEGLPGLRLATLDAAEEIQGKAETILSIERATTPWFKIADPGGLTDIELSRPGGGHPADWLVALTGHKQGANAIEFGHAPSGVFGPGGKYEHIPTKAPEGLYIMHRAAGLI